MADMNTSENNVASQTTGRKTRVTREAYDVIILMKAGLGSNKIAKALGLKHPAVISRQNTLQDLGVISGGTMQGERRRVLMTDDQYTVEAEHRSTIRDRARRDREEAKARDRRDTNLKNLAKARDARKAKLEAAAAPAEAIVEALLEPAV